MLSVINQKLGLSVVVFLGMTSYLFGQSDLAKLIDLIDQEKFSALTEIKQLREANSQNRQQAALFDFGYGLSAIKFGRAQEAIQALQPFVEQRPQVYQARLLLLRAYIDLEQFDNVILQAEKMLQNFPTQTDSAQKIATAVGTLVGFLNFARPDCADELKKRLEDAAATKIPEEFIDDYRESIALVESRVATIKEEIKDVSNQADAETESKVEGNLSDAEKLRKAAEAEAEELKERDKLRAEKYEELKLNLQQLEREYANTNARHVFLDNQNTNLRREQRQYEKEETTKDKDGKTKTETRITNDRKHRELGRAISRNSAEMSRLENSGRQMMNSYQQLRGQAAGLLNQQQLDELFSKDRMRQFGKGSVLKERKAERELGRIGKGTPATRGLNAKLKNYATYEPLDVAANKEYLQEVAKKVNALRN